jgi:hypothetical protein
MWSLMPPCCYALRVLLQPEGLKEMYGLINFYKENATILKNTFQEMGFEVYGEHPGSKWSEDKQQTTKQQQQ